MTMPAQKPHRSKQDYGTPPEFLVAVKRKLGIVEFDCDLAANRFGENAKAPAWFSESDNSLDPDLDWAIGHGWNWLNPPFTNLSAWTEKTYREADVNCAKTVMLVPASVGANWWRDWVHDKCRVLFLNGRITFEGTPPNPKTGKPDPYPKDCALLLYGQSSFDTNTPDGYEVWSWTNE